MDNQKEIIITEPALANINEIIYNYIINTSSIEGGQRLYEDIQDKISLIGFIPEGAGRLRENGDREAFVREYRIVYTIKENKVYIITVLHSRMIYPRPINI